MPLVHLRCKAPWNHSDACPCLPDRWALGSEQTAFTGLHNHCRPIYAWDCPQSWAYFPVEHSRDFSAIRHLVAVCEIAVIMHHIYLRGMGVHCTGYGNDTSILGVPDIPIWLLRHDGELPCRFPALSLQACQNPARPDKAAESLRCLKTSCEISPCCTGYLTKAEPISSTLDRAFWDPVSGSIMDSRQCLDTYPGFPGVSVV